MADVVRNGFLRDSATVALSSVYLAAARRPLQTRSGFLLDSTGALVIVPPGASP